MLRCSLSLGLIKIKQTMMLRQFPSPSFLPHTTPLDVGAVNANPSGATQRDVNYVDGAFPVPAATSDGAIREAHGGDLASLSC